MNTESIFFIQENDVACFFTHTFCLIEDRKKKRQKKKQKIKLLPCC